MIMDFTASTPIENKPTEKEIRDCFNKLDADGSGSLELPEIIPLVRGILVDLFNNM